MWRTTINVSGIVVLFFAQKLWAKGIMVSSYWVFYIGAEKSKEQRCEIAVFQKVTRRKIYGPK
jgi:hypothetical protein